MFDFRLRRPQVGLFWLHTGTTAGTVPEGVPACTVLRTGRRDCIAHNGMDGCVTISAQRRLSVSASSLHHVILAGKTRKVPLMASRRIGRGLHKRIHPSPKDPRVCSVPLFAYHGDLCHHLDESTSQLRRFARRCRLVGIFLPVGRSCPRNS